MLKRIYIMMVAALCCAATFSDARAQGVTFSQEPLDTLFARAKKEGKLVFMDCYTSWCGPCKMLAREVFVNDTVGTFFNRHFANVKMDMERGEGPRLARRYQVGSYPTLLFISPDNKEVVYRVTGARRGARWLVDAARKALDPSSNLVGLATAYAHDKQDTAAVARYLAALSAASLTARADSVLDDYLAGITEANKHARATWTMLERYVRDPYSSRFSFMLSNASAFSGVVGQERVNKKLADIYYYAVLGFIKRKRVSDEQFARDRFNRLRHLLTSYTGDKADILRAELEMIDCVQRADYQGMMNELDKCERQGMLAAADTRFYFVWLNLTYLCESTDKRALKRGLKWADNIHPLMADSQMEAAWQSMVRKLKAAK